jgi:hypothetical protein
MNELFFDKDKYLDVCDGQLDEEICSISFSRQRRIVRENKYRP